VWRACLDGSRPGAEALARTLSAEECARGERFHFERDRTRFRRTRGLLRVLAGRYLDALPEGLELSQGATGKPRLRDENAALRFNVSHSGGRALLAFAWEREVGVDIEAERPVPEMASLVERFFSPAEAEAWRALPPSERDAGFFRCWTLKEAFLKATGDGLMRPLDSFDVAFGPRDRARLLRAAGSPGERERWHLETLEAGEGFHAAVAVEGRPVGIWFGEWAEELKEER